MINKKLVIMYYNYGIDYISIGYPLTNSSVNYQNIQKSMISRLDAEILTKTYNDTIDAYNKMNKTKTIGG